jgi:hypothetical protein
MFKIKINFVKYCCAQECIYRTDLIEKYKNIAPDVGPTRIILYWFMR